MNDPYSDALTDHFYRNAWLYPREVQKLWWRSIWTLPCQPEPTPLYMVSPIAAMVGVSLLEA